MATTYLANLKLRKPEANDPHWNVQVDQNFAILDTLTPIGGLAATFRETPSVSLYVQVSAGGFKKADGTPGTFAGATVAVPNNASTVLYLDGSGNLTQAPSFPTSAHVRIATVTASGGVLSGVSDQRISCSVIGTDALAYLPLVGGALSEGANISTGTVTGTQIATAPTQKLAFWGGTPIARPGTYTQTYSTADRTITTYSSDVEASAYAGLATGLGSSPYAAVADLNALRQAYENLRVFAEDVAQAVNAVIDDLQSLGLFG